MARTEFSKFIENEIANSRKENDTFWGRQKTEWFNFLEELYSDIELYLREFVENRQILIEYIDHDIVEDHIGSYRVRSMLISIGSKKIRLVPIGTALIGTKGRVDLIGPSGSAVRLILADKCATSPRGSVSIIHEKSKPAPEQELEEIESVWKIVVQAPSIRFVPLTRDTFTDAIMEVANG